MKKELQETVWYAHINYLRDWANNHNDVEFRGMSPACFDEWQCCEDSELEE